jgi:crotonobetainyl-CoA hydratase
MSDEVHVWREGGILEVTLDRPKANAIDLATSRVMGRSSPSCATTRSCW